MAMTARVKDELSRLDVTKPCCRKSEVAAHPAVRGRAAHRRRPDRRRGRARHRQRRPTAPQEHRRPLRPPVRGPRPRGRWAAQGQPLRRAGRPGRRGAGPPDRADRRPRPSGARPAAQGGQRLGLRRRGRVARRLPRPRLAHRARPVVRARGDLPRSRGGAGPRRRGPPARASRPRPARSAGSTGSSSATATPSARCSPGSARTTR